MTIPKSLLTPGAALLLALWGSGSLRAADGPLMPMPVSGSAIQQVGGCSTCGKAGPTVGGCKSCGHGCGHTGKPYVVNLCPGACFGYFQTQWRKWDDVCPYPYQGIGVTDAPRAPAPILPSATDRKKPGTPLPDPRPVDPKAPGIPKTSGSDSLPLIPKP